MQGHSDILLLTKFGPAENYFPKVKIPDSWELGCGRTAGLPTEARSCSVREDTKTGGLGSVSGVSALP